MSNRSGDHPVDHDSASGVAVMIVPEAGGRTRSFRVAGPLVRWYRALGVAALIFGVGLVGSWVFLAIRASRIGALRAEVAALSQDSRRVDELARELESVEAAYEQIRGLFGASDAADSDELWLPPGTSRADASASTTPESRVTPTEWPLTESGFVTRTPMTTGGLEDHPGIDIAVPSGAYVRAAGAGTVREAGSDEVYGNYVVVDHGEGYETVYGHASVLLISAGDTVRQREVIALTGSTGRSTAPHLHFEILREGEAIDPLSLVAQP